MVEEDLVLQDNLPNQMKTTVILEESRQSENKNACYNCEQTSTKNNEVHGYVTSEHDQIHLKTLSIRDTTIVNKIQKNNTRKQDQDFRDVTLACDDQQIQTHKLITTS